MGQWILIFILTLLAFKMGQAKGRNEVLLIWEVEKQAQRELLESLLETLE